MRVLSILVALFISSTAFAQSTTRVALIEQVTSASCGPCASQNPAFNTLLEDNDGSLAVIKFQRGGGSYIDPMWDFNTGDVDSRIVSYYGVTYFPNVWINGTSVGSPASVSQITIDNALAVPAYFELGANKSISSDGDTMIIDIEATALADFTTTDDYQTRLVVAVIEKEVNYTSAPGLNGEKDFKWVMRDLMPFSSGERIGYQTTGQVTTKQYKYFIDHSTLDASDLEVVAFIQNRTTGEVHQAVATMNHAASVKDVKSIGQLEVYPTVLKGDQAVTINFVSEEDQEVGFTIRDITGKVVYSHKQEVRAGLNLKSLRLPDLTSGMYLLVLSDDKSQTAKRLLIQ